ncbi:LOB domain-containing protein 27-like [Salvia splendens]|uniref:LOB domain-containing protein 27-like n=1 Tax=Salvia splendens TaxID=180675 RepID=UPI001100AF19|nr:LOB domain-containing protein 27-like [Salvia splendens]
MTLRSGSGQACAACKFQRRRCTPQCLLAPFFPADQPQVFQSVHRLFGVKHIQKLLKELHPDQRVMAIKSVKFHAAMRERNPVYGCLVEVQNLASQVQIAEEELHAVLQQLFYYRQQQQQQQQQQDTSPGDDYLSQLQLGMAPPGNTAMAALVQQDGQSEYNNLVATQASSGSNNVNVNVDSLLMQKTCSYSNNNNDYHNNIDSIVMQSHLTTSQTMPTVPQDYNEMYSFFDNIDDRQSYVGPKEVYESSLDSSVRDCTQSDEHMAENELKNAAACFSLTSFN